MSKQVVHYFQHVEFEDLAVIQDWILSKGHTLSRTAFYAGEPLPDISSIDWLIILGGPMNIYEHDRYPWLIQEKKLIRQSIDQGKKVLGICLGAQLIADVLGGKVTRGVDKEIGWYPIRRTSQSKQSKLFAALPETIQAFHWHGDTFAIPPNTLHGFSSQACEHQAFTYADRVVGLQFHLESTRESIQKLLQNCPEDLTPGPYSQSSKEILSQIQNLPINHEILFQLLNLMESISKV
ncbi:MAG: type 1 glutamine amidotransferase [Candidatus Omnitrophica bacterium]|nr:type 1 glutamine amidotransferase [Candidatus Omnitrophota bacterium]